MKLAKALATLIAVGAGVITLLGYFGVPPFSFFSGFLLGGASLLAAVGIWVGAINLFVVHGKKVTTGSPGWVYSLILIVSLVAVIVVNIAAPFLNWGSGPANSANQWIFKYLQTAAGAAIAGLLFFFLVLAGYRMLGRRASLTTVVFVVTAVLTLIALAPWPAFLRDIPLDDATTLRDLLRTLTLVPSMAGARGLLLGIALGIVATGLRLLLAQDRPYRE